MISEECTNDHEPLITFGIASRSLDEELYAYCELEAILPYRNQRLTHRGLGHPVFIRHTWPPVTRAWVFDVL